MGKHCPTCRGTLIWGGEITDRRRAWCPSCGARFHRRAGWGEAIIVGVIVYGVVGLFSRVLFRWTNPLGLSAGACDTVSSLMAIAGVIIGVVLAERLTREKRRLTPAHELCATCSYDLRGIDSDQCPECGCPISPSS